MTSKDNPIDHWNGNDVYLWLNPAPFFDWKANFNGLLLQIPLDYIDCNGSLLLRMNVNWCADMYLTYGSRWQMAVYDAAYKLFDGKIDLDYPDSYSITGTISHKGAPKEWKERELFDDMPRIEDFENKVADKLVEESNTPVFKHMFGNSLKKTKNGLKIVEA